MDSLLLSLWIAGIAAVLVYLRYIVVRGRRVVRFRSRVLSGGPRRLESEDFGSGVVAASGFSVPIEYSSADEGYVVGVTLGKSRVYLVLDSGSQYVATATRDCVDSGACRSAKDGGYIASDDATTHDHDKVSYGSLTIENVWTRDTLGLSGTASPCDDTKAVATSEVWIAAAKRMIGTDSNILGLMAPYSGSKKPCFLQSMFESLGGPRVWWIQTSGAGGRLGFGRCPWDCLKKTPITLSMASEGYLGGYIVPVQGVFARRSDAWVKAETQVRFALLDTGTYYSYFPQNARPGLEAAGFPCGQSTDATEASLWLGNSIEPLVLRYPRSQFGFQASSEIADIIKRDDTVLLGILHMQDSVWEFDLDRNVVRFAV